MISDESEQGNPLNYQTNKHDENMTLAVVDMAGTAAMDLQTPSHR